MAKKLSAEFVDELGEIKRKRKALQEKEKDLVDDAKELMEEKGAPIKKTVIKLPDGSKKIQRVYSPKGSEFEFVHSEFPCLDVSWREEFEAFYTKEYGAKAWKKYLRQAPRRTQTQLDVNEKEK